MRIEILPRTSRAHACRFDWVRHTSACGARPSQSRSHSHWSNRSRRRQNHPCRRSQKSLDCLCILHCSCKGLPSATDENRFAHIQAPALARLFSVLVNSLAAHSSMSTHLSAAGSTACESAAIPWNPICKKHIHACLSPHFSSRPSWENYTPHLHGTNRSILLT